MGATKHEELMNLLTQTDLTKQDHGGYEANNAKTLGAVFITLVWLGRYLKFSNDNWYCSRLRNARTV